VSFPTLTGTINRTAPVAAIVGGVVGGALAVGGLVLLALFKTGRIKGVKRNRSPSPAAAASGAGLYPTIPENPPTIQYPVRPQYPEPIE